jgi:alkylation response protein AidB-like acyl-CoA dehydrogenase
MDLAFDEHQEALAALARDIFDGHVTMDRLKEVEAGPERFDRALWAELARANLLGAGIAEEHGGIGGGILEACLLLEQAAATVAPVPLWPTLVLGALPITRFGSAEVRTAILPRVARGDAVLTAALNEPDSDDPADPRAVASWEGDAWRLEGVKTSVPAAHIAERVLVPARTSEGSGVFLLDPRAGGVDARLQRATNGEMLTHLELDGAAVPESEVLVEPGTNPAALQWMVDAALTGICAMQVGLAERALKLTAGYLTTREQFDRPLAKFQAVQQRAADCYIDVEAMRWTTWQAVWRISQDLPAGEEVEIAKFWSCEGGHRVMAAAQHLHGGIGVDMEDPLHRYTLTSKQLEMTLGGATRHLARLGDRMAAR